MAKLKNNFSSKISAKLPSLGASSSSPVSVPNTSTKLDQSAKTVAPSTAGSVVQALKFGSLHTKITGSGGGSDWGSLLSSAASGGITSTIGGGILSSGAFGFVGKLLSLFGGSKSTPAAPTPFVMPASQIVSLNIGSTSSNGSTGSASSASSVALGVTAAPNASSQSGPVYQQSGSGPEQSASSTQVVQIVKQALLTSSSLNDVISEI